MLTEADLVRLAALRWNSDPTGWGTPICKAHLSFSREDVEWLVRVVDRQREDLATAKAEAERLQSDSAELLKLQLDLERVRDGGYRALYAENQWLCDLNRERDEAKAEVERLSGELKEARRTVDIRTHSRLHAIEQRTEAFSERDKAIEALATAQQRAEAAELSVKGRDKAIELLNACMKSVCDDRDRMKHEARAAQQREAGLAKLMLGYGCGCVGSMGRLCEGCNKVAVKAASDALAATPALAASEPPQGAPAPAEETR